MSAALLIGRVAKKGGNICPQLLGPPWRADKKCRLFWPATPVGAALPSGTYARRLRSMRVTSNGVDARGRRRTICYPPAVIDSTR